MSSILGNLLDNKKSAITLLKNKISKLTENDLLKIVRYALKYPPRATALLGAILEFSKNKNSIEGLRANLNPLTSYKIGIKEEILPTAPKWNIS